MIGFRRGRKRTVCQLRVTIIRYLISVEILDVVLPVITNFQFRRTVAIVVILMQMERKEMRKTMIE